VETVGLRQAGSGATLRYDGVMSAALQARMQIFRQLSHVSGERDILAGIPRVET